VCCVHKFHHEFGQSCGSNDDFLAHKGHSVSSVRLRKTTTNRGHASKPVSLCLLLCLARFTFYTRCFLKVEHPWFCASKWDAPERRSLTHLIFSPRFINPSTSRLTSSPSTILPAASHTFLPEKSILSFLPELLSNPTFDHCKSNNFFPKHAFLCCPRQSLALPV
jgi:hypothetical protein